MAMSTVMVHGKKVDNNFDKRQKHEIVGFLPGDRRYICTWYSYSTVPCTGRLRYLPEEVKLPYQVEVVPTASVQVARLPLYLYSESTGM